MPVRKSQSSDVPLPTDSRRSSMKRLSSFASLQHLNPFHRRRSDNTTDDTPSCSSNIPLSSVTSTTNTISEARKLSSSTSLLFGDTAPLAGQAPLESQASFLRRSSYVCLPDDPVVSMPRSRTFSNLPIPSRTRKAASRAPSIPHARNSSGLATLTRLPTPPASTRKHIPSSIPAAFSRPQYTPGPMQRSDTMPLLSYNADRLSELTKPTGSKGNVPTSPVRLSLEKQISADSDFVASLPASSYLEDRAWEPEPLTALPRQPIFSSALSMSRHTVNPATRENQKFFSSPAYGIRHGRLQSSEFCDRPQLAQRWNSQPILTNSTNLPFSTRHEIKQTRLMSARQAPTPPPPRTPLNGQALTASLINRSSTSTHPRTSSNQSVLNTIPSATSAPQPSGIQVATSEPPAYWCGRISALLDRYRNEELNTAIPTSACSGKSKSETDKLQTPAANATRLRKALEHLYAQCITEDARESFVKFQLQFALSQNIPELGRPIKVAKLVGIAKPKVVPRESEITVGDRRTNEKDMEADVSGSARSRKVHNLFDRMLGRKEKRVSHG